LGFPIPIIDGIAPTLENLLDPAWVKANDLAKTHFGRSTDRSLDKEADAFWASLEQCSQAEQHRLKLERLKKPFDIWQGHFAATLWVEASNATQTGNFEPLSEQCGMNVHHLLWLHWNRRPQSHPTPDFLRQFYVLESRAVIAKR
jgi:hypothetical protein